MHVLHALLPARPTHVTVPVDDLAALGHRVVTWSGEPARLLGHRGDAVAVDATADPDPAMRWVARLARVGVSVPVLAIVDDAACAALPPGAPFDGLVHVDASAAEWVARLRTLRRSVDRVRSPATDRPLALTDDERLVLATMTAVPGQVFSRAALQGLRGSAHGERAVDVFISRLRRKLPPDGPTVEAVFRRGYRVVPERRAS